MKMILFVEVEVNRWTIKKKINRYKSYFVIIGFIGGSIVISIAGFNPLGYYKIIF